MASIIREPNGRKTIQFVAPDDKSKRPKIRLGKATLRDAEFVKNKIERLVTARVTGRNIDPETAEWVASLPDDLANRIAEVGLIENRAEK